ncbi:methyltransferase [Nocardia vinacea]|uniref:methyltransferase n=1 Tax=Nocardia vinacea TaxID=96468 RepID=UPI00030204FF|nr:methyltransferase [Nocardia vinacea]
MPIEIVDEVYLPLVRLGRRADYVQSAASVSSKSGFPELAFVELAHSITTGQGAYARRYGQDFWADLAEYPYLRESFDRQMTHRFREQIPRIVAGFDWSRFSSIVDVGGGQGSALAAPHGLVLDTVTDLTDQRCLLEFRLAADELTATVVSDNSDRYPDRP